MIVVVLPGAKQEGVLGLAKGMGKGVVGLVMRPTGGLIDLASGSLDTVRRYCKHVVVVVVITILIYTTGAHH